MNDLFILGQQISAEYQAERKKLLSDGIKKLIGIPGAIVLIVFILEWLYEKILGLFLYSWPGIISFLFVVVFVLGTIVAAGYAIFAYVRYKLPTLYEDEKNLKKSYMDKMAETVFSECFKRTLKENNFSCSDVDEEICHFDNNNKIIKFNPGSLLYLDKKFTIDDNDSFFEISIESDKEICQNYEVFIQEKESDVVLDSKKNKLISVDNHRFSNNFNTYCEDKITAFRILTPAILNKIMEVNDVIKIKAITINNNSIAICPKREGLPLENTDETVREHTTIVDAQKQADAFELMVRTLFMLNQNKY